LHNAVEVKLSTTPFIKIINVYTSGYTSGEQCTNGGHLFR